MNVRNKQCALDEHAMDNDQDDSLRLSEQALFEVLDALADASVDPQERKIIWGDGARLSIEDTARRIHSESGMSLDKIESHVIGWLEMTYEPRGLNEQQMEEFELLIERWITPYDETL
jgi:hypothetical protein